MKSEYLIVGGGLSGLISAVILQQEGHTVVGLEQEDCIGGKQLPGFFRVYREESLQTLKRFRPELNLTPVCETILHRKKGIWSSHAESLTDEECYFLQSPALASSLQMEHLLEDICSSTKSLFQVRKAVVSVDPVSKVVGCQDGSSYEYETLVWCSPIEQLRQAWRGDRSDLFKIRKSDEDEVSAFCLEMETREPIFPFGTSATLPFRFKEFHLRALGGVLEAAPGASTTKHQWVVFLNKEIGDNTEEVAKCVRTLRREIEKEFGVGNDAVLSSRIVFFPCILGTHTAVTDSIEIAPSLFYVGPQLRLESTPATVKHLDLTLDNARLLAEKARKISI